MMQDLDWREENGAFVAETAYYRLTVLRAADRRCARFLVWKLVSADTDQLIGSGTTGDIRHGMVAAEKMAERLFRLVAFGGRPND